MTTITIKVSQDLTTLKNAYRRYYGMNKKEKVTKDDVSKWLAALAQADVEDYE